VNCRFGTKREAPFEIAPGSVETLQGDLHVLQPGDFSAQLHIFYAADYTHEVVIQVSGQSTAKN
jgi:hypothetical protein